MKKQTLPPTYFLVCLILLPVLHMAAPVKHLTFALLKYLGIILIALGVVINIKTDNLFKTNRTTVKPNEKPSSLIVNGPFKISRNPMYLGMLLILLGLAMLLGSMSAFIIPIVFIFLMETRFITAEENVLKEMFGNKYLEYRKKTRRWI